MNRRAAFLVLALVSAAPAGAHPFTLTEVTLQVGPGGRFRCELETDLDALALGEPQDRDDQELRARIQALAPAERARLTEDLQELFRRRVRLRFDQRPVPFTVSFPGPAAGDLPSALGTRAVFEGAVPAGAREVSFFASRAFPPVRLSVADPYRPELPPVEVALLEAGEVSPPIPLDRLPAPPTAGETARRYLRLGFVHILPRGLDHILFVLGLFLLAPRVRPLLLQVSAFTVAHTATLALATVGWVRLPAALVEPLIALSIVYVAVENLLTDRLRPHRTAVVFAFGLLHGLGFAGVLTELGLPPGQLLPALLAFNTGVELGQLAVLALAFLALGAFLRRPWFRSRVAVPLSLAIAAAGLFWAVERVWG